RDTESLALRALAHRREKAEPWDLDPSENSGVRGGRLVSGLTRGARGEERRREAEEDANHRRGGSRGLPHCAGILRNKTAAVFAPTARRAPAPRDRFGDLPGRAAARHP